MPKAMKRLKEVKAAGERIADAPGHMQAVAATKWSVYPETARGIMYVVVLGVKGLACDCPQGEFGKGSASTWPPSIPGLRGGGPPCTKGGVAHFQAAAVPELPPVQNRAGRPPPHQTRGACPKVPVPPLRHPLLRDSGTEKAGTLHQA